MASSDLSPIAALTLVGGSGAALVATAAGFWVWRRVLLRMARLERADVDPTQLNPGRVALGGTVEVVDGDDVSPPVRSENGRVTASRPFLLRLASGVRVRIEPGDRPLLRDARDVRGVAELTAGEQLFARGIMHGRISTQPNANRAVVTAPRFGKLVISTKSFSEALERQAGQLRERQFILIGLLVITQLLYVKLYIDAVRFFWFGGTERPTIAGGLFFWVALVIGSVIAGCVLSAREEVPPRVASRPAP